MPSPRTCVGSPRPSWTSTAARPRGACSESRGVLGGESPGGALLPRLSRLLGAVPPRKGIELVPRAWFNENLESRNFYVPGVIALIVMLLTLTLSRMAVVRGKEVGTIEQILVSPITPAGFILGKTPPL